MGEDIYLQNKVKGVLDIYSQIELDLLEVIIKKLKLSDGEIGGSLSWYLKRLDELGGLNTETLKVISKYTGITQKELKMMLESIGIETIDALNLQNAYRKGKITINPMTFYKDIAITNLINNSYDSTLKTFLDINKNMCDMASQTFSKYGLINRVKIENIDALEYLQNCKDNFDFIFVDGPKGQYIKYWQYLKNIVSNGGIIFCDDVLYFGMVLDDSKVIHKKITIVRNLREFINITKSDVEFESKLIDIEDGILILEKK